MASRRRLKPRATSRMHKKIEDFYLCINEGGFRLTSTAINAYKIVSTVQHP